MAITKANDKINKSLQEMGNLSFDTNFNLNAVEALVYNEATSAMDRMVQPGQTLPTSGLNGSYSITQATVGDVTTKTIVKTIGATSYTKTIAKNNVTKAITVSVWS